MVAEHDRRPATPAAPVLRPAAETSNANATTGSSADDAFFFHDPEDCEPFENEDLHDDDAMSCQDDEDAQGFLPAARTAKRHGVVRNVRRLLGMETVAQPDVDPADELRRRREAGCVMPSSSPEAIDRERALAGVERDLARSAELEGFGIIEKRSPWWIEGWRSRAYVLRDRRLLYFLKDRLDSPLGVLDFNLMRFEVHCCWLKKTAEEDESRRSCDVCTLPDPADWRTLYLKPTAFPSKIFAFRGPVAEMISLSEKLRKIIATVPPSSLEEQRVLSISNFWRYPQIRESDYVRRVESGDILLFRSKDRVSKLQRAITSATYDHVALLLRTQRDQILVLEATGRNGVNAVSWASFKAWNWHRCYERLVYRKVYFPRTQDSMVALQNFVSDSIGKPYGLTMTKLLGKQSSSPADVASNGHSSGTNVLHSTLPNGESHSTVDMEGPDAIQSFFCSELTAACLQSCGVLDGTRDPCQYWPGSFSQYNDEPLPLQTMVSIGEEQTIMYDV